MSKEVKVIEQIVDSLENEHVLWLKNNQIINFTETYMGQASPVRELQSTISAWRAVRAMYTDRDLFQAKLGSGLLVCPYRSSLSGPPYQQCDCLLANNLTLEEEHCVILKRVV